jgi:hypothetical protein
MSLPENSLRECEREDRKKGRVMNLSTHEEGGGDRQGSHSFECLNTSCLLSCHHLSICYSPVCCLAGFIKKLHQLCPFPIPRHLLSSLTTQQICPKPYSQETPRPPPKNMAFQYVELGQPIFKALNLKVPKEQILRLKNL